MTLKSEILTYKSESFLVETFAPLPHCDLVWQHFPLMTLLITFSLRALLILGGERSAYHLTRCEVRSRSIPHEQSSRLFMRDARIGFLVVRQHETEKITSP